MLNSVLSPSGISCRFSGSERDCNEGGSISGGGCGGGDARDVVGERRRLKKEDWCSGERAMHERNVGASHGMLREHANSARCDHMCDGGILLKEGSSWFHVPFN